MKTSMKLKPIKALKLKRNKTILLRAGLIVACFILLFGGAGMVSADCTDIGSDGIADNIITVCRDSSCNCICDGVDDHVEINYATANVSSIGGARFILKTAHM